MFQHTAENVHPHLLHEPTYGSVSVSFLIWTSYMFVFYIMNTYLLTCVHTNPNVTRMKQHVHRLSLPVHALVPHWKKK